MHNMRIEPKTTLNNVKVLHAVPSELFVKFEVQLGKSASNIHRKTRPS